MALSHHNSKHRANLWIPMAAGLLTAFLCAVLASTRPLFHDEASTWYFTGFGLPHLFDRLRQDVHPPLYFLLSSAYFSIFGSSMEGLRLVSAVLMGAAVSVFCFTLRSAIPALPRVVPFALATSPFLIFCGYFARYYSLTCLIGATVCWVLLQAVRSSKLSWHLFLGVLLALAFLSNYAAALILGLCLIPYLVHLIRRRQGALIAACVLPGVVAGAAWMPVFVEQIRSDSATRWTGESATAVPRLAKSLSYLVWCMAGSDGLAPWNPWAWPPVLILVALAVFGTWTGLRTADAAVRVVTQGALGVIGLGGLIGWLLLPGPMYIFLPPRIALCGFAWLLLAVVVPLLAVQRRGLTSVVILSCHGIALMHLLVLQKSTNWAYQIPAKQIAETATSELRSNAPGGHVAYLPAKSLGNIRFYLETESGGTSSAVLINPKAFPAEASRIVVIRESRNEEWPPASATGDASLPAPEGVWHKVSSVRFLTEDDSARRLKSLVTGRSVMPDKIRLDVWQRE